MIKLPERFQIPEKYWIPLVFNLAWWALAALLFLGCASVHNPICLFNCGDRQIFYPPR